jgi:hypothetical protein
MSKLSQSETNNESTELSSKQLEGGGAGRRLFAARTLTGLASAFLVACGQATRFSGGSKVTTSRKSSADGLGSGTGEDAGDGSGELEAGADAGSVDGADETVASSSATDQDKTKEVTAKDPKDPGDETLAATVGSVAEEKIDVSKAVLGDNSTMIFKFYGEKSQAMLALARKDAAAGFVAGDMIYVLQPVSAKVGRVMSHHKVFAANEGDTAHIFDNLYLANIEALWIAVTRGPDTTIYQIASRAQEFETTYHSKPVIDSRTILDTPHPDYFDHMPTLAFSGASNAVSGDLKQYGSLRPYIVAQNSSTWTEAKFQATPSLTNFAVDVSALKGIEITDAVGRPIATPAAGTEIIVAPDFLAKHSTLILYTNDNDDHWHRYFKFLG